MSARRMASPFPTLRPLRPPESVLRATKPPAPAPRSSAAARVGATVRLLRKVCGASSQVLAQRAGISRSLLSRLERGLISPSLDTLESVASALGVSGSDLLQEQIEHKAFCHVPAGQGICLDRDENDGCRQELLAHQLPGLLAVEPCLVVQRSGAARLPYERCSGIRFIYVLSGRGMCAHGSREVEVRAGDALLFDANVPHGMRAIDGQAVAYTSVLWTLRD